MPTMSYGYWGKTIHFRVNTYCDKCLLWCNDLVFSVLKAYHLLIIIIIMFFYSFLPEEKKGEIAI
jgi:hypothetical protein